MSKAVVPWRNWYHVIGSTFGAWLPGDPKGFRTHHHDEHVEGDYRHPPPEGMYDEVHERAKRRMTRLMVSLEPQQRVDACRFMVEKLVKLEVEVIVLSMGAVHYHVLARFTPVGIAPRESPGMAMPGLSKKRGRRGTAYDVDPVPREMIGIAKKHVSHEFRQRGWRTERGGLFASKCKVVPIEDRSHQVSAADYIRDHVEERAAVYWMGVYLPLKM